jgi:DNA-directed RNA polymerase III subunit RPC8
MDPGEEIRFRVTGETFVDTSPTAPDAQTDGAEREDKRVPFTVHASVNEPGLGLLTWWNS